MRSASRVRDGRYCRQVPRVLGAERAINYKTEDFVEVVKSLTHDRGVDVILDMVAGLYVPRELSALADGGRLVLIALLGGAKADVNLGEILRRRLTITGSTLRPRPVESGADRRAVEGARVAAACRRPHQAGDLSHIAGGGRRAGACADGKRAHRQDRARLGYERLTAHAAGLDMRGLTGSPRAVKSPVCFARSNLTAGFRRVNDQAVTRQTRCRNRELSV